MPLCNLLGEELADVVSYILWPLANSLILRVMIHPSILNTYIAFLLLASPLHFSNWSEHILVRMWLEEGCVDLQKKGLSSSAFHPPNPPATPAQDLVQLWGFILGNIHLQRLCEPPTLNIFPPSSHRTTECLRSLSRPHTALPAMEPMVHLGTGKHFEIWLENMWLGPGFPW